MLMNFLLRFLSSFIRLISPELPAAPATSAQQTKTRSHSEAPLLICLNENFVSTIRSHEGHTSPARSCGRGIVHTDETDVKLRHDDCRAHRLI
ncbi:hypothetical protein GN956_G4963 [Arapaima gigas]